MAIVTGNHSNGFIKSPTQLQKNNVAHTINTPAPLCRPLDNPSDNDEHNESDSEDDDFSWANDLLGLGLVTTSGENHSLQAEVSAYFLDPLERHGCDIVRFWQVSLWWSLQLFILISNHSCISGELSPLPSVTPLNILRYNQVYKFKSSEFKFNIRVLLRFYLNTESQCSRMRPSRFRISKEQAKDYCTKLTTLYTRKPHVRGM